MNEKTYWGHHLIINAGDCNHSTITDYNTIHQFAKQLVKQIDMVAYGEPQIVKFGHGDKQGYTLVQLIETSNICAHFVDETNDAYIDVFSCKPFDEKVVINLVKTFFEAKKFETMFIDRQA
jgi:S-adenosylmethionine/arginine decarboxylase-like enzyme